MLINDAYIEDGHLIAVVNEESSTVVTGFTIENGRLYATVEPLQSAEEVIDLYVSNGRLIGRSMNMAKVDLGQVVGATGPKGDTGATGPKGDTGATGKAATISIGTVTTGAAGSSATVTNAGTSSDAVLNFSIPKGATGSKGATGAKGADGISPTFSIESGHLYADYDNPYTP